MKVTTKSLVSANLDTSNTDQSAVEQTKICSFSIICQLFYLRKLVLSQVLNESSSKQQFILKTDYARRLKEIT